MFQTLKGLQKKSIAIVVVALAIMAALWFAFLSGDNSDEPEIIGFVGATKTFVSGDTITESCTLNGDVYATTEIGFTIGADDITIDGNGFSLIGPWEQGGEEGIHCEGHSHITIKDLNIDYFNGINFENVTESEITGCEIIKYSYGTGIWLQSSSRNQVTGNTVGPGDGGHGILLWGASENTISDNNVQTERGGGIFIEDKSKDNRLEGNTVCGNHRGDIFVDDSSTGNSGSGNTFDNLDGNFEGENSQSCPE